MHGLKKVEEPLCFARISRLGATVALRPPFAYCRDVPLRTTGLLKQ